MRLAPSHLEGVCHTGVAAPHTRNQIKDHSLRNNFPAQEMLFLVGVPDDPILTSGQYVLNGIAFE